MDGQKKDMSQIPTNAFLGLVADVLNDGSADLESLKQLRIEMKRRGFDAPFGFLVGVVKKEFDDINQTKDLKKQLAYFRKIATMKKYALFSTNIAIAARKIKNNMLANNYTDFLDYLPVNGDYLETVFRFGNIGARVYKFLIDNIRGQGTVLSAKKYFISGEDYTYTKTLLKDVKVENHLREGEQVVKINDSVIIHPLIRSKYVGRAICCAIVGYSGFISLKEVDSNTDKLVAQYNSILTEHGYMKFSSVLGVLDQDENLKKELESSKLLNGGQLDPKLSQKLKQIRKDIEIKMQKIAKMMLAVPIAKHYLLKSKNERISNPLYPSMPVDPSLEQLKILNITNEITKMDLPNIVGEKLDIENLGDSRKISIGLSSLRSDVDRTKEFFKTSEADVKSSAEYVENIKHGRGQEFVERLKHADKKQ